MLPFVFRNDSGESNDERFQWNDSGGNSRRSLRQSSQFDQLASNLDDEQSHIGLQCRSGHRNLLHIDSNELNLRKTNARQSCTLILFSQYRPTDRTQSSAKPSATAANSTARSLSSRHNGWQRTISSARIYHRPT